ncbi:MAG: DUF3303 domain-containing protein [Acidimicrobiales bacterium]
MLFQVNYRTRVGGSAQEMHDAAKRGLALFSKWSPPAGMEIKSFYARADGNGGTVIVDTNDVKALADGPTKFGFLNDFEIVPILDITEGTAIGAESAAWVDANS